MNQDIQFLGEKILEHKQKIAKNVHEARIVGITEEEKRQLALVEKDILEMRVNFIGLFGQALKEELDQETAFERFMKWGKETGEISYQMGVPLHEALKDTSFYRTFLWKTIQEEIKKENMSIDTVFEVSSLLDPMLDYAAYCFGLTYVRIHEQTLENAKNGFLELSVPVVPVTKNMAILPLIGNIDTERARLILEQTLQSVGKLKFSQLVIDLSGVAIVDTMVADQLFKVVAALRLLGVETILTGIRPEIAQTVVSLGVDFKDLKIKANLHQALNERISISQKMIES